MNPGRIAGWGYEIVVPDLYLDGGARRCLVATMRALSTGKGEALVDIKTSRQWLLAQPETTEAVGIIGFCMGGGFALLTCDRDRYAVASVNYGTGVRRRSWRQSSTPPRWGTTSRSTRARGTPSSTTRCRNLPPWLRSGTWRVSGAPERTASTRGAGSRSTSRRTWVLLRKCLTT